MKTQGTAVRSARIARWAQALVLAFLAAGGFASSAVAQSALSSAPVRLVYRVDHSVFGNIGTYSNTIEKKDGVTTVLTHARFRVHMLGMVVHSEDASRIERWKDGRLIYYSSTTETGGHPVAVTGRAQGDKFVINTPAGTIKAPANVHPANPWSANFLDSHTMMRVDSGKIERVSITGGGEVPVKVADETVFAHEYEVAAKQRYLVWINERGVPVKFAVYNNTGKITFTLTDCAGCGASYLYARQQ